MRTFTQAEAQKMFEILCFMSIYEVSPPDSFYKPGTREWHWEDIANRAGVFESFKRMADKLVSDINKNAIK